MRRDDKRRAWLSHRSGCSGSALPKRRVEAAHEAGECSPRDGWMLPTRRVNGLCPPFRKTARITGQPPELPGNDASCRAASEREAGAAAARGAPR